MDGVHDMGGMDGFGKVEAEQNEPPFHAPWEGRVLAMQRAMGYAGAWHIDHSRFAQEKLPPATYLSVSYYHRWALAMESNVLERGYATPEATIKSLLGAKVAGTAEVSVEVVGVAGRARVHARAEVDLSRVPPPVPSNPGG